LSFTAPGAAATAPAGARALDLWMCTALVVGNVIGVGVFFLPAALAPYGLNAVTGWLITIVGCIFLAITFSGLARCNRASGKARREQLAGPESGGLDRRRDPRGPLQCLGFGRHRAQAVAVDYRPGCLLRPCLLGIVVLSAPGGVGRVLIKQGGESATH
jgi:hypothetical protein